jgi:hypothetical protein
VGKGPSRAVAFALVADGHFQPPRVMLWPCKSSLIQLAAISALSKLPPPRPAGRRLLREAVYLRGVVQSLGILAQNSDPLCCSVLFPLVVLHRTMLVERPEADLRVNFDCPPLAVRRNRIVHLLDLGRDAPCLLAQTLVVFSRFKGRLHPLAEESILSLDDLLRARTLLVIVRYAVDASAHGKAPHQPGIIGLQ